MNTDGEPSERMERLAQLLELLQRRRPYAEIARLGNISPPTVSNLANTTNQHEPRGSTIDAIERGAGLPRATVRRVMDGELTPGEGAALFDTRDRRAPATSTEASVEYRLASLEAGLVELRHLVAEIRDRLAGP